MRKKKFITTILALALAVLLPLGTLASTWEVHSWDDLVNAFADPEATVTIILYGDIEFLNSLELGEGQTYLINGEAHTLTNVQLHGTGTAEITAMLSGDGESALNITDGKVTVNGDITSDVTGVNSRGSADVTVNGNITAESNGVYSHDESNVTVNGNVSGDEGVDSIDQSTVTVNGNVIGIDGDGIEANDSSTVTVNGNVSAEGDGIEANDDSTVIVNGDVSGGSGDPDAVDYSVPSDYSDGDVGIDADGNANVTVNGNVTGGDAYGTYGYGGDGIIAEENATVSVSGNVTGGSVTADPNTTANEGEYSLGGNGVVMDATATVTVGGDVQGGNTNGDQGQAGHGALLVLQLHNDQPDAKPGHLTIYGTATGGTASAANGMSGNGQYFELYSDDGIVNEQELQERFYPDFSDLVADGVHDVDEPVYEHLDMMLGLIMSVYGLDQEAGHEQMNVLVDQINEKLPAGLLEKLNNFGFSELSQAELDQFITVYNEVIRAKVDEMITLILQEQAQLLEEQTIPGVTVYGVRGGDGAERFDSNAGQVVTDLLSAEVDYFIRVAQSEGGTVAADKETAKAGETITITATPQQGYQLDGVYVSGAKLEAVNGVYTYTVPEGGEVTVSAKFTAIPADPADPTGLPKTGDEGMPAVWLSLITAAGLATLIMIRRRLKETM